MTRHDAGGRGRLSIMATALKPNAKAEAAMHQKMMPWLLVTEIYWMSYKLLERRFYHLGVSASQARVCATGAPYR